MQTGDRPTFPNLYVFLTAPPGVGKQVIDLAGDLFGEIAELHKCPDSVTKASLVDALAKARRTISPPGLLPVEYHSLYIQAEEIGVLLPEYSNEFLSLLNKIWNNPKDHKETRRASKVTEAIIPAPQFNLLAGVQPGWMAHNFPEVAWTTGLMSRVIMIYHSESQIWDIFAKCPDQSSLRSRLLQRLTKFTGLWGEFAWHPAALAKYAEWHFAGGPPKPSHSKLQYYCNRRSQTITKLCLVSAVMRGQTKEIELVDFTRALAWLLEAEQAMPDIFRAMVGKSDAHIIEELHFYLTNIWKMQGQKPVHRVQLQHFLASYLPSQTDAIPKLLQAAEAANVIARLAGTETYVPRPKHLHGMEG